MLKSTSSSTRGSLLVLERVTQSIARELQSRRPGRSSADRQPRGLYVQLVHARRAGPTDFASASASDSEAFARFHQRMMEAGVWLPPSQFEAAFVSSAHGQAEVEMVLNAATTFCDACSMPRENRGASPTSPVPRARPRVSSRPRPGRGQRLTNAASNWLGGNQTPASIMRRWKRAKASLSDALPRRSPSPARQ